jgi:hypothetical protein
MQHILAARDQIYNEFQRSAGPKHFFKTGQDDRYAAYYTSMFLIQDTAESLSVHRKQEFSRDPHISYLEFWGVMQAVIIQQNAIGELYRSVVATALNVPRPTPWSTLRDFRIQSAGHPANRTRGVPAAQRSFMGRMSRDYAHVQYELWDASTNRVTHPTVNLGQMLDEYDVQAAGVLADVLQSMKQQWP